MSETIEQVKTVELPKLITTRTLVEVRPIIKEKVWHGKKDKESFTQTKTIEALYDSNIGGYATGLTEQEAEYFGKMLNVSLSNDFNSESAHPTWSTKAFNVNLENRTMIFDISKPMDFIKVRLLKASKFVANSMKEYNGGDFPEATHVIFDEAEDLSAKANKVSTRTKAYQYLAKMSSEDKVAIIQVLSNKSAKGRSMDFIDTEVGELVDSKPEDVIKYLDMGKDEVYLRANILELLDKNILTKEGGAVYYMGDMLAIDYEGAIGWFKDPNNQKMKVVILEKLQKK